MGRVTNAIFETEKIKNNSSDGEELTKLLETRRSQIKGLPSVFFMLADGNNLNRGLGTNASAGYNVHVRSFGSRTDGKLEVTGSLSASSNDGGIYADITLVAEGN